MECLRPDRDQRHCRRQPRGTTPPSPAPWASPSPQSTTSTWSTRTATTCRAGEVGEIVIAHREAPPSGMFGGYYRDAGRHDGRLARRLLPHRRHRLDGRGRLLLVCRPHRRRHQVLRLPHRAVRDRERADGAPRRAGVRGHRRARPGPRPGGQGDHRADQAATSRPRSWKRSSRTYVKKQTAPYKYPRIVEFVDELPKTISGKIRRTEIRAKDQKK